MISFENNRLNNLALPMSIVRMLTTINEYKDKQDLYKRQSHQILNTLKDVAIIQSAESSNRNEIRTICPDIGEATINRVFEKLRVGGKIEDVGKGRNSKWKKL